MQHERLFYILVKMQEQVFITVYTKNTASIDTISNLSVNIADISTLFNAIYRIPLSRYRIDIDRYKMKLSVLEQPYR
jgi:hypothetical protein